MAISPSYAPNVLQGGGKLALPATKLPAPDPEAGAFLKLGFGLLLLDTFLSVSRSFEILDIRFHVIFPYVATAIHMLAFMLALVTGGVRRIATSRTGIFVILYTGWMLACTPFSAWRGGSVQSILYDWMPSLLGFLTLGLLSSLRQCRKLGAVLACCGLTIAVASFFVGVTMEGRFSFPGGTLGNANDLAMLLLLTAPFFLVPLLDSSSKRVVQFLALPAGLLVVWVSFRTGSRASLLALVIMLVVLFFTRSLIGKLKLAGAMVVLAAILMVFIPSYSIYRYTTIFSESSSAQAATSETLGSSALRKELLYQSLAATLEHPVFGVGPGVFAAAMAKKAEVQGQIANWRVTHNTYTQVSSEMGIPGLIVYLAAIFCAYLDLLWVRRHSRSDPSAMPSRSARYFPWPA